MSRVQGELGQTPMSPRVVTVCPHVTLGWEGEDVGSIAQCCAGKRGLSLSVVVAEPWWCN